MDKEKIYELAQKKESELTKQDIEYLNNLTKDDEDIINTLISININYIKYLKLKEEDIDISEGIIDNFLSKEIYEQLKNQEILRKLNINNKKKFISELLNNNEELIKLYERNQEKINEKKIIKESSIFINKISKYLNDYTIMGLLYSGADIPSITNNEEKINAIIEKGGEDIIDYINTDLITEELVEKVIEKGYIVSERTPEIIKNNPKYIEKIIENGNINAINFISEEILEQNENLIYLAINKGYKFYYYYEDEENIVEPRLRFINPNGESPKILKNNPKFIKYLIEQGQKSIINYTDEKILEQNENLIYLAIDNGFGLGAHYKKIFIQEKYMEYAYKTGHSSFIEEIDYKDENVRKQMLDNNIWLSMFLENHYKDLTWDLKPFYCSQNYFTEEEFTKIKNKVVTNELLLDTKTNLSLKKYWEINDKIIKEEYKNYIMKNIDSIDEEKIELIGDLLCRLATTNSKALYSMRESLAGQLLTLDNSVESFNKIEKIFIRNNIPLYAKMYFCFKTLYPNLTNRWGNMLFDDTSRMSPELKDSTLVHTNIEKFMTNPTNNDIRFYIIYNDLLRNAVKSNSTDLRKYLDNIELGDYLYKKIIGENITNEKFDNLSELEKKEALEIFTSHLETIYHNTKEGKQDKTDFSNYDLAEKIKYLKENFKTTNKYDLKDRIVRSFGYSAGYTSFIRIRNEMKEAVKEAHERGIKLAQQLKNKPFEFEDGDFLRSIGDYQAFSGSIENGNFSKEFLTVFRETNDSDTTPLDIDFTLIEKKQSIYHSIERTPTGFGFGNVFLVIKKDNPNLNITRDKDGNLTENKYDPKKLEMFGTKIEGTGGYQTHWGVRTGMSLTDVDYILFKEERQIDNNKPYNEDGTINYIGEPSPYDDLSKIKFEIARHGYYIPVIDFTGKIIFSVDEYNNLKEKMNGLSYYENNQFKFSNNLEIDGVKEITPYLDKSNEVTEIKRNKIYDVITPILEEHNLKLKTKIDGDLAPGSVEIIDTGSTGRKTNKIGDGDFDFLLRIDQKIFRDTQKYEQLKNNLKETIEKYPYESLGITDKGDYRFKKVQLDKDTVVDIDLSFTIKTDKITYSTDECLKDRLRTIEKQDKEKYKQVVSNIILAKQIIKKEECYKPSRSDENQGGLGGSGIETWILQNGGSFKDAAQDFLKTANTCNTFEEFKKQYFIWDFGENHFAERKGEYPHDNFVDNMNDIGYKKMKECLKQYLQRYNQENMLERSKTL